MTATPHRKLDSERTLLGATPLPQGGCEFLLWAPKAKQVTLHVEAPQKSQHNMQPRAGGYHFLRTPQIAEGDQYWLQLDGGPLRPDPASRFQPEGPHGPSQVVSRNFPWTDQHWKGLPLEEYVFYELHVGTFTVEGTLDAIIPRLDALKELGITAIELMPIAQFPGNRNWDYDGTYPFSVHNSYGGPAALHRLVDQCHQRGMAVVLDVVYNHLGPEGNYLGEFGAYFSDRYRVPWGQAINFDGPSSDDVRRYFIENALSWVTDYHLDGLRLDAIHAIFDSSAIPFLQELTAAVHLRAKELQREIQVFPESDCNDARHVKPAEQGGFGMDAQWNDDFHHALHVLLTGERNGYYEDFHGTESLARSLREGFVFQGEHSAYRRRRHGSPSAQIPPRRLIVFSQNHDQTGNRMLGERLTSLVDFESLKLAACSVLLSPYLPLLFMGEEYAEPAPFQYFVSHGDAALVEAVRVGRKEEFSRFGWKGEVPDPQSEETFARCQLNWNLRNEGQHKAMLALYVELMRLRRTLPCLKPNGAVTRHVQAQREPPTVLLHRESNFDRSIVLFNFARKEAKLSVEISQGSWRKLLDSSEVRWRGGGASAPESLTGGSSAKVSIAPVSCVLFHQDSTGAVA